MNEEQLLSLGEDVFAYCRKFNIPTGYLFEILEDQKVTPMIRGKAMEYNAYLLLENILPRATWSVQKLNLNAQPGAGDEDISITHRRTGIKLRVECKSAVRGSISDGRRTRIVREPHFKVKCHKSRSNISLAGSSNDRYPVDSFDLIITNTSNAIYEGNTIGEDLEIVHRENLRTMLYGHYNVESVPDLIQACENDWRFTLPASIAVDGFIPRTPYVILNDDPNWHNISDLEQNLLHVVEEKRVLLQRSRR